MSLFEEYERRTALYPKPLFNIPTQQAQPTQSAPRQMTEQERLQQLKTQYEMMKYQNKIRQMQQPRIRVIRTAPRKSRPLFTASDFAKAKRNLQGAYSTTSKVASVAYKKSKSGYQAAKSRYQRSGGVGGVKAKVRTFFTGSIYK